MPKELFSRTRLVLMTFAFLALLSLSLFGPGAKTTYASARHVSAHFMAQDACDPNADENPEDCQEIYNNDDDLNSYDAVDQGDVVNDAKSLGACPAGLGGKGNAYRSQFITYVYDAAQPNQLAYFTTNVDFCTDGTSVTYHSDPQGQALPTTYGAANGLSFKDKSWSVTKIAAGPPGGTGYRIVGTATFTQKAGFGPFQFDAGVRTLVISIVLSPTGGDACTATPTTNGNKCYANN